jgi:hypothetical protein
MSITAVVKRPNLIVANTTPLTTSQSMPPVSLKNNVASVNNLYLHNLVDIVESNPQNGSLIIYNAQTDKYEVRLLESEPNLKLDGGSF